VFLIYYLITVGPHGASLLLERWWRDSLPVNFQCFVHKHKVSAPRNSLFTFLVSQEIMVTVCHVLCWFLEEWKYVSSDDNTLPLLLNPWRLTIKWPVMKHATSSIESLNTDNHVTCDETRCLLYPIPEDWHSSDLWWQYATSSNESLKNWKTCDQWW
jgi:hypothetical protein